MMISETIEELRKLKEHMESMNEFYSQDELFTLNKAIIACEQLRKYRKKAKRWKRKYQTLIADMDEEYDRSLEDFVFLGVPKGGAE